MAKIWFGVNGHGLMPVDLPDSRLEEILERGYAEIRVTVWKGALSLNGTVLVKLEGEPKK